jgi:hypothetical protein
LPDRQTIARIVERVFTQRGIPRRGETKPSPAAESEAAPSAPAAGPASTGAPERPSPGAGKEQSAKQAATSVEAPPVQVSAFVSENDVRSAIARREKIFIGPRTIVTPSARDLAAQHEIFVETQLPPSRPQKTTQLEY